jgi:hypothetical protein
MVNSCSGLHEINKSTKPKAPGQIANVDRQKDALKRERKNQKRQKEAKQRQRNLGGI